MHEISNISYINFLKEIGISCFLQDEPNNFIKKNSIKNSPKSKSDISEIKNLDELEKYVKNFNIEGCSEKNIPGHGNINSNIMIIGNFPSIEEAKTGKPFGGPSGSLLNKMLKAININREDIYLTYIIPKFILNNKTVSNNQLLQSLPIIQKEIEIIKPKIIILLGSLAAKGILNSNLSTHELRRKWHKYKSINSNDTIDCIVTFDPEFLIKNKNFKKDSWDDLKKLKTKIIYEKL